MIRHCSYWQIGHQDAACTVLLYMVTEQIPQRDKRRKEQSQTETQPSQMKVLFPSFVSTTAAETVCKMCTLRLVLCSFNVWTLPPSLIWCFQICTFTSACTKAFIISFNAPLSLSLPLTHTHTQMFEYTFQMCRLEGFLKLANAPHKSLKWEAGKCIKLIKNCNDESLEIKCKGNVWLQTSTL